MAAIHLLTPEYPPMTGGVSDYVHLIAQCLAAAGEDVHVWCPSEGSAQPGDPWTVHPELGRFRAEDRARTGDRLDRFSGPRRLLVQWVPHGYGYQSMNLAFCFWLWKRAALGDRIELMVHEPYLAFWEGSWRQNAAAVVHRLMTMVLLRAASRVWISIPAWERSWKPYALGRPVPFTWLPIPSGLSEPAPGSVETLRRTFGADRHPVIGHFGTHGGPVASLLDTLLADLLGQLPAPQVLLIGSGSERFREAFLQQHPAYADRIHATGTLAADALAAHVAACDLLVQPYPDGISSRRTTAMAGLRLGVAIATTRGRLTEPLWESSGAVSLADVGDSEKLVAHVRRLLDDPAERRRISESGRALYDRTFDIRRSIEALTTA